MGNQTLTHDQCRSLCDEIYAGASYSDSFTKMRSAGALPNDLEEGGIDNCFGRVLNVQTGVRRGAIERPDAQGDANDGELLEDHLDLSTTLRRTSEATGVVVIDHRFDGDEDNFHVYWTEIDGDYLEEAELQSLYPDPSSFIRELNQAPLPLRSDVRRAFLSGEIDKDSGPFRLSVHCDYGQAAILSSSSSGPGPALTCIRHTLDQPSS